MGVTNSNKTISPNQIACDGSLLVTLSLTAAPDIITDPTDIVLTLDRSSSMQGDPLANLKLGAKPSSTSSPTPLVAPPPAKSDTAAASALSALPALLLWTPSSSPM